MGLWVGTYAKNGGKGLHALAVKNDRLEIGPAQPEIVNASYAVWDRRRALAYFVDEQDVGRVSAWRLGDGGWSELSSAESGGAAPCYLDLSPDGGLLAVANYADGSVGLLSLDRSSGAIGELVDLVRPTGRGVDPERQDGPHAHCVLFGEGGNWLYHVDLGLDRVLAYPVDGHRLGTPELAFAAPPGSGPRHLMLHPDRRRALLICELSAEVHLLERRGPAFVSIACEPTSPREGDNLGGHLSLIDGGSRIAVTNRGHDDLTVFALTAEGLERQAAISTRGASPRQFWSQDGIAVVANEQGGNVALLSLGSERAPRPAIDVAGACFVFHTPDGI